MAAERRPTIGLKDALFNQYQAILVEGTAAFALLAGSFLPFLLLAGAEFIFLPLVVALAPSLSSDKAGECAWFR